MRGRPYRIALFHFLRDYYLRYLREGLPPLNSPFSRSLTAVYTEEHPHISEIFGRCVEEDSGAQLSSMNLLSAMKQCGYNDGPKKLTLWMDAKYKDHKTIKKVRPQGRVVWKGLRIVEEGFF